MTTSTISPLDGRYHGKVKELSRYVSESALIRYRVMVEVEYLIALGEEKGVREFKRLSPKNKSALRTLYKKFSDKDAEKIKQIEAETNHDVKAVEYFIKNKIHDTRIKIQSEFIHFALTSEDINNLAYSIMWRDALQEALLPTLATLHKTLLTLSKRYKNQPMLSLTHGQPATPTTVGKEFAVFAARLKRQFDQLKHHALLGKLNGATGTYGAMVVAYPNLNWQKFSQKFVESFGFDWNPTTTQIEPHDSLAESFHIVSRTNTILLDFTRDTWLYISRGIFGQKKKEGEVGSSTMPHKINPIQFENAEGNLGLANALLHHLAEKLPISRMQRDLTDSTVLRNIGVPLGHSLLAYKSILTGLSRLTINKEQLNKELDEHWEVLAEPIQTVLRKVGHEKPYEKLKELTRGEKITKTQIRSFIQKLDIPKEERIKLLKLTPQSYIGIANTLATRF